METRSISAYDLPERVAAYDADMDVMHPNRTKMVDVALEVLPFSNAAPIHAVDLGTGTAFLARRFLERFPESTVVAVDGASAMLELARARLGPLAHRVRFVVGDFRSLATILPGVTAEVILSSFALHHLTADEKRAALGQVVSLLRPGGWFVNCDLVVSETPELEERAQALRVEGIVARSGGRDSRFADARATRLYLDEMEAKEGDKPLSLACDLALAREAGLLRVDVLWKEYREAVWGGMR